jgi:capsid portal protein
MKNNVKFFEFGVSLGNISFVQNWDMENETETSEEVCVSVLEKLMDTNLFETEELTYGMVISDEEKLGTYYVSTRPYVDGWSWDFDHDDTKEVEISL